MAQKPMLRGEVGCACVAREVSVERGGMDELELIQSHMAQKPVLRGEVDGRARSNDICSNSGCARLDSGVRKDAAQRGISVTSISSGLVPWKHAATVRRVQQAKHLHRPTPTWLTSNKTAAVRARRADQATARASATSDLRVHSAAPPAVHIRSAVTT